jgi:hypothetical protein
MAALTGASVRKVFVDGEAARIALYAIRDCTTGDTVDLGVSGAGDFLVVKQAAMLGDTISGSATATASGTVVTIPTGLSLDAIWLLAWGDAAT